VPSAPAGIKESEVEWGVEVLHLSIVHGDSNISGTRIILRQRRGFGAPETDTFRCVSFSAPLLG
jgi:hypothetical protein